jgi:hypothetical protein
MLEKEGLEALHDAGKPYDLYPYGKGQSPDTAALNPEETIETFIWAGFVVWKGPETEGDAIFVEFKGHPRAFHNIPKAVKKTAGEILLVSRKREAKRLGEWIDKHPELGFVYI